MPDPLQDLLRRLVGGDVTVRAEILAAADTSDSPTLLVAAALVAVAPDLLARAAEHAVTTRDRQLIAVAAAHLADNPELLDALVRDHLSDHPDNLLAAWIAALHSPAD